MIAKIFKFSILMMIFAAVVGISAYVTLSLIVKSEDTVVVPDLVGQEVVAVLEQLSGLGLNIKVKGFEYSYDQPKNHIISQDPEPGYELKKGRDVRVLLSKGVKEIIMPNLHGIAAQQAMILIEQNGLCRGAMSRTYSDAVRSEAVIGQSPPAGAQINREACVDLLISMGKRPQTYQMPDLAGMPLNNAILLVESYNLSVGEIKMRFDPDRAMNVIIGQQPEAGYPVDDGGAVNLEINRNADDRPEHSVLESVTGVHLFRYRLRQGFLKRHIRVRANMYGNANDLIDEFVPPGQDIWLMIPKDQDATLFVYENDQLMKTEVYNSW